MKKILLLLFAVAVAIGAAQWIWGTVSYRGPLAAPTEVMIDKGAGSGQVAHRLTAAGVIDQPRLFSLLARFYGLDKQLKAGEYHFEAGISMLNVMHRLASGEVFYRRLTLPEGLSSFQMMELIKNEPALSGELTLTAAEGELLPETYTFSKGESRNAVLTQARQAMQKALDAAWKNSQNPLLNDKNELLILASIIEKETGLPSERADVAAVFVNRLQKGMKLQTDPTVIYAVTMGQGDLGRPLLKKDLEIDSPYNTYRNYGLPPTPICNPGKAALQAAGNPSDAEYLYFVASGKGGHRFAKTLNEHNSNVSAYRRTLRKK